MSLIPFVVQCQTCGSRLKVTDPSLIGTIASCPKCNSMVQIAPESNAPASNAAGPQVAVGSANVDTGAITEDAIDAGNDPLDSNAAPSGFTAGAELESAQDAVSTAVPPDWQSERTQRSRQIGLIVALSLSSLIAAIMLFGWFVRSWRDDSPLVTAAHSVTETEIADPTPGDAQPMDDAQPEESSQDQLPSDQLPSDQPPDAQSTAEDPVEAIENSESDDHDSSIQVTEPAADSSSQPNDPPPPDASEPDPIPSDLLPQSPLDPLAPIDDADDDADDDAASKLEQLPEGLQQFVPVLNLGPESEQADADSPPAVELELDEAADHNIDPMLVATPPEPINLRRALSIEFALSSANGKYPMSDLILTISQITGVPIQIDWVTFDLVGVTISDEVTVIQGWNSAEAFLESIAASVGAEIEKTDQMLKLAPSEVTRQEQLGKVFDLTDFADGQKSATAVLNRFLPWGDVKVSLEQDADQQKLAALAVEALRRIRGVAPKVADANFQRWAQSADGKSLDWPVLTDGHAGPQYDAPLTMAGFLRRTARGNQATCFVNWFDANLRRMSPAQLTMPFTGAKAGDVIANELKPFGLQLRQVDQRHWWVGTQATYDRFPVIIYTGPLGADRAVLAQRLENAAASSEGGLFRMAIDPDTGSALLLLPRYLVRQLPKIQNGLNLTKAH